MNITAAIMWIMPMAKYHFEGDKPETDWSYDNLVWDDKFYPKPTLKQLEEAHHYSVLAMQTGYDYRIERSKQYPTAEQQLQMIFDLGVDGWKERIQNVKNNVPKPE
jgi:hypothetical protein